MAAKDSPKAASVRTAGRTDKAPTVLKGVTVHLLYAGRTFCGMQGVPSEWPETHKWIGIDQKKLATCQTCLENFEKWEKKRAEGIGHAKTKSS